MEVLEIQKILILKDICKSKGRDNNMTNQEEDLIKEIVVQAMNVNTNQLENRKPKRTIFAWIADGLTINETKSSALILVMLSMIGLGIYQVVTLGDVSVNLTEIIKWSLMAVAGASGLNAVANSYGNNNNDF